MEDKIEKQKPMQINTGDEMSRGRFSNSMFVSHSPEEFIIDWLLNSPTGTHLVSRIIVSPGHLKRIIKALKENLQKFEDHFGSIQIMKPDDQKFN